MSDVSDISEAILQEQQSARVTAIGALDDDPEQAARAHQLSEATGVPALVIYGDVDNFERNHKATLTRQLLDNNPHLQEFVNSDPMAAKISNDDLGQLDAATDSIKQVGAIHAIGKAGLEGFKQASDFPGLMEEHQKLLKFVNSPLWQAWLEATGLDIGALALEGSQRLFSGIITGGAAMVGEASKQFTGSSAWGDRLTRDLIAFAQVGMSGQAGFHLHPELATIAKKAAKAGEAIQPYLEAGQLPPVGVHPEVDAAWKQAAQSDIKALDNALSESTKSKTRERAPALFEKLARSVVQDANIEISAEAVRRIYGENLPEPEDGKLGWVPNLKEQMETAEGFGGSIQVPLATYLARMDKELAKELREDIRVRPQGLTLNEVKELKEAPKVEEETKPEGPEGIAIAAVRAKDGAIYSGINHGVAAIAAEKAGAVLDKLGGDGFLTTTGRFVNRQEAFEIADKASQIDMGGKKLSPGDRFLMAHQIRDENDKVHTIGHFAVNSVRGAAKLEPYSPDSRMFGRWFVPKDALPGEAFDYEGKIIEPLYEFPAKSIVETIDPKRLGPVPRALFEFFSKRLGKAGDTPVHVVPTEDIELLSGERTHGVHIVWESGHQEIFLSDELVHGLVGEDYASRVIMHEVAHAATSAGLDASPEIRTTVKKLMDETHALLTPLQQKTHSYAFTNEYEFLAEARSKPSFQQALAKMPISKELAEALKLKEGGTIWDQVREIIRTLISKITGREVPDTILDGVLKLGDYIEKTDEGRGEGEVRAAPPKDQGELDVTRQPEGLEWKNNEAHAKGRKQFSVEREKTGWKLYRYSQRMDGTVEFRSKESVKSREAGQAYAEHLWSLSGGRKPKSLLEAPPLDQSELDVTRQGDKPVFDKAAVMGRTSKEFKNYMDLIAKKDKEDAEFQLKQAEKEERVRQTKEWKENVNRVRQEVTNDLSGRPDVAIGTFFNEGRLYGEGLAERPKLDTTKLSTEQKEVLPRTTYGRGGLNPDDVAQLFGLQSGDELVVTLAGMEQARGETPFREYVSRITKDEVDRRMKAEYGDLETNILEEAKDHVISTTQMDLLHEQVMALAMQAGHEISFSKEDVKAWAKSNFGKSKVGQFTTDSLLRDAGKSGRMVERSLLDGEPADAFKYAQQQYLSMRMADEAKKFEKEMKRFETTAKRFSKREVAGISPEYTPFIQDILLRVGKPVRRSVQDLQEAIEKSGHAGINEFVKAKYDAFREITLPDWLADPNFRKSYKDLTVQDFKDLHQTIKEMVGNGRNELQIFKEGEKFDLDEKLSDMKAKLEVLGKIKHPIDKYNSGEASKLQTAIASSLTIESVLNRWDKDDPRGVYNQFLVWPLTQAGSYKAKLIREYQGKLHEITRELKDMDKLVHNDLFIDPLDDEPFVMRKRNLYGILQIAGDPGALVKLAKGYGLEPEQIMQWLFERTTKEDWDRAQKIGDLFSELHDKASEMLYNISGVPADKIDIQPIRTPYGDYKGWYNPVKYDNYRPGKSKALMGSNALEKEGYFRASTPQGYLKQRTGYIAPMELNLDIVPTRMQQMIHDIAMRPAIVQTSKIFYDSEWQRAVIKHYGKEYQSMFIPYLEDIANFANHNSEASGVANGVIEKFRQNLIAMLIGFNPHTVLKHGMTAAVNSLTEVGPINFLKAFSSLTMQSEFASDSNWNFAKIKSEEIQRRMRNIQELIQGQPEISLQKAGMRDMMIALGSKPVAFFDLLSAVPTWLAQYTKSMKEEGMSEGQAIFEADRAVRRAHGSSAMTNRAEIMRSNPLGQTFASLYGFFSHMLQKQYELSWKAKDSFQGIKAGDLTDAKRHAPALVMGLVSYVIIPALVEEFVTPLTNKEHESWGAKAAKVMALGLSSSLIGVRDIVHAIVSHREPQAGLIPNFMKTGTDIAKDLSQPQKSFSRENAGRTIKHAFTLTGALTGLTNAQEGRTAEFLWRYHHGLERPKGVMDWARGLTRGTLREFRH